MKSNKDGIEFLSFGFIILRKVLLEIKFVQIDYSYFNPFFESKFLSKCFKFFQFYLFG